MKVIIILASILAFCCAGTIELLNNPQGRIINGILAEKSQFPWHVGIFVYREDDHNICSGVLISERHVISTVSCFGAGFERIHLILGTNQLYNSSGIIRYAHSLEQRGYNSVTRERDMLIVLIDKVEFTDLIHPIRLPALSQENDKFENLESIVSGWGATAQGGYHVNDLRYAGMRTISNDQCQKISVKQKIFDSMICAVGNDNEMTRVCHEDFGSPLIIKEIEDGKMVHTLIGITFSGERYDCAAGVPSFMTRTTDNLSWIKKVTGIEFTP